MFAHVPFTVSGPIEAVAIKNKNKNKNKLKSAGEMQKETYCKSSRIRIELEGYVS